GFGHLANLQDFRWIAELFKDYRFHRCVSPFTSIGNYPTSITLVEDFGILDLRWEAFPKGQQELGGPLEPQSPAQQAPEQVSFFGQEAEPPPAVSGHAQGGAPDVPLADEHRLVSDDNGGLLVFISAEDEVESGVQPLGSVSLKDQGQATQEALNRSWPEAVPDPLGALVCEAAG